MTTTAGTAEYPKMNLYVRFVKPVIDFILSLMAMIILSPLMLIIAILIKLTSEGPVLFKQERLGLHQKVFEIYKFRSMCINAEHIGDGIRARDEDDPRITKVGKFIRRTSIDELPQLFNILKGDMAIVGPRPPVTYHPYLRGEYDAFKRQRFNVKPGLTGLAQAKIRNRGTWDERIVYDVEYVQDPSFIGDVKIIFETIATVAKLDR